MGRPSAPETTQTMLERRAQADRNRAHRPRNELGLSAIFDVHPDLLWSNRRKLVRYEKLFERGGFRWIRKDSSTGIRTSPREQRSRQVETPWWQHHARYGFARGAKPRGPGNKDEEARQAVNQRGNSVGDAGPAPGWFAIQRSPATCEDEGFEGQDLVTGKAAARCWKRHEPHDWNSGAISGEGRGGVSRQGGAKPRRWNAGSVGNRSPKQARRRAGRCGLLGS